MAALDRLAGAVIGVPAAYLEGIRQRQEARNRLKLEQISIGLEDGSDAITELGRIEQAAMVRLRNDQMRKQINREAVCLLTEDALVNETPTKTLRPLNVRVENDISELDGDWIDVFASYAERASKDDLRKLWARILAGEIRKPGTFSLSALRVISELDRQIAMTFQDIIKYRFEFTSKLVQGLFVLTPDPLTNEALLNMMFLEETGLLAGADGKLNYDFEISCNPALLARTKNYYFRVSRPSGRMPCRLRMIKVANVGQQIASILPWEELAALRQVRDRIKLDTLEWEIGEVRYENHDGMIFGQPTERNQP